MANWVIIYDISNNRRRTRLFKKLEQFGLQQLQLSAFAGPLTGEQLEELRQWLTACEWQEKEQVWMVPVDADLLRRSYSWGRHPDWPRILREIKVYFI